MAAEADNRWERGSMAAEAVLLTPLIFLLILFVVAFGRVEQARIEIANAARGSVEAAVVWPTASQAIAAGEATGAFTLHSSRISCTKYRVEINTSNFVPGGSVGSTIYCTVLLSDVAFPGLPGSLTLTGHASAPLETYRSFQ